MSRPTGQIGATLLLVTVLLTTGAPLLTSFDPFAFAAAPLLAPSLVHPMGTDAVGRDLFSEIMSGARASVFMAIGAALLACAIGGVIGLLSGYLGGMIDDVFMRITELFQTLPRFFLVVVTLALFGAGFARIVLVLGLTSWTTMARVMRGEVLLIRELEFVVAARASGAPLFRVLWRHMLPNILPSALVLVGLLFGQALLLEASIGFLGLADPNTLSWGTLAGQAQGYVRVAWWLALFPGLAIAAAAVGVNLLADAFSDAPVGR